MLFSSNTFIYLFLPLCLLGYQLLARFGSWALITWLSLASLFFYGFWKPAYLVLLLASILANYLFSRKLGGDRSDSSQGVWLTLAILANLLVLGYYKYFFPFLNFLYDEKLNPHQFQNVLLPLGISFFTFTQIAYLIDLRQGVATRKDLLTYSLFVTFFPHLIAGPIIHPREMMPQFDGLGPLRLDDIALGTSWFVMGLAKKVLIADRIAPLPDALYAHPGSLGFAWTWLACLCYAMQLYFDFSGYSDMALGLARMFSIQFPLNFNSPYKAPSIIEFWQRWHMTLSRYLSEYLYTPILRSTNSRRMDAGKKVSRKAQATPEGFLQMVCWPTMSTMFLAGIWHGAGLQYVVFGVLHGAYLVVNHGWRLLTPKGHPLHAKVPPFITTMITFIGVLLSFVFFRANSMTEAATVLGTLFGLRGFGSSRNAVDWTADIPHASSFMTNSRLAWGVALVCLLVAWGMPNTQEILGELDHESVRGQSLLPGLSWRPSVTWSVGLGALFLTSLLMLDAGTNFLYFQF